MGIDLTLAKPLGLTASGRLHVLALLGLVCLALVANWDLVRAAVRVWIVSPTYSHCFFILPISTYLIWSDRKRLGRAEVNAYPLALLALIPIALVQLAARAVSIIEIQQLAVIAMLQILTVALLGTAIYRQILFPMLYLFFLVPTGEYLVGPLQNFTAGFISAGLDLLGILHHTEGTVIELVNGTYRVAEACAGLRFLIATVAVGALFCHFNFSSWRKILLFMGACVTVPVIANGFRALGIVLLAHFTNNEMATGADHLVYGWGFSVVILLVLMWIGSKFADARADQSPRSTQTPYRNNLLITAFAALFAVIAVPAVARWEDSRAIAFEPSSLSKPAMSNGWSISSAALSWKPNYVGFDARAAFSIRAADMSAPVDVHILYFKKSRNGVGLVSSTNTLWKEDEWRLAASAPKDVELGSQSFKVQELLLRGQNGTVMVWWTYWDAYGFTISGLKIKMDSLSTLMKGRPGTALFALSTPVDSDQETAEKRLAAGLSRLEVVPRMLRQTARLDR